MNMENTYDHSSETKQPSHPIPHLTPDPKVTKITCIICSINPERSQSVAANIHQTAGIPVEIIIHDNRTLQWGLCKVYNHCASQAVGEVLCFLHEDVFFRTENWGAKILHFYHATPRAGVVGFFGSQLKTHSPSTVGGIVQYEVGSLIQHTEEGEIALYTKPKSQTTDFTPVIQIDGLCMFVRKSIWSVHPFDEKVFDGFHLYDLDFSIQIARNYQNYICHSIVCEHLSKGVYSDEWFRYTQLFQEKWGNFLPMMTIPLTPKQIREAEAYNSYKFYKNALKANRKHGLDFARKMYRQHRSLISRLRLARHLFRYWWKHG